MKVGENFTKPDSSFYSVEKDLEIIIKKLLKNDRLVKLLYYHERDCLQKPKLTSEQLLSLIDKQIRIIPEIDISTECPIYICISFRDFKPNANNPEFRDNYIYFHILCHPDHWHLGNFALRPYRIAGEIDASLQNQKFTGIGELHFAGADNIVMNEQLIGLTMAYEAVHGSDDIIPRK